MCNIFGIQVHGDGRTYIYIYTCIPSIQSKIIKDKIEWGSDTFT